MIIALALVSCSEESNEETSIEQESSIFVSSESAEESLESAAGDEKNATYNPENGEEMAELFRAYYGAQKEIYSNEFEQEQEKNYVYPEIFTVSATVSADVENDTVRQITFFEVGEKDIRTILKIAVFPEEPTIEEALSFEGDLDEPKKVPSSF